MRVGFPLVALPRKCGFTGRLSTGSCPHICQQMPDKPLPGQLGAGAAWQWSSEGGLGSPPLAPLPSPTPPGI
jgi:hypothetical protein